MTLVLTTMIFITLVIVIYTYITRNNNFWMNKKVPHPTPRFFYGNYYDLITKKVCVGKFYQSLYNQFAGSRFVGVFQFRKPVLMITSPDDIKRVMISDFNHFQDRGKFSNTGGDPLSNHLFNVEGDSWKPMRQMITPTFTTGKLKNMFNLIVEVADQFTRYVNKIVESGHDVDVKEMCARFTTDVIGTCGFGLSMDSLENENSEFRNHGKMNFQPTMWKFLIGLISMYDADLYRFFRFRRVNKKTTEFFRQLVRDIMYQRQQQGAVKKNDFIELLLELKNKENNPLVIDETFIASQAYVFFNAGFETSSTLMTFTLYQLAMHPDIQTKVQQEIEQVLKKQDNKITYESMVEMAYLDMVICETQRFYPALTTITRICTSAYTFPDSTVSVDKGIKIVIPVYALHFDPKYYPEPEKFNPERFSNDTKDQRTPMTFLPFGEGPRNCIAMRLGKIQSKVGLVTLLKDYTVEPYSKTTDKITINPPSFVTSPKENIYLKFIKR